MLPSKVQSERPTYRIASISADGIAPGVISAGIEVLRTLAWALGEFEFEFDRLEWGSDYFTKHGKRIPEDGIDTLKKYDAILLGSATAPDVSDHVSLWDLHLAICQSLQQFANVRPTRVLRGTTSPLKDCRPGDIGWLIIHENSEGEHTGHGGRSHVGQPWEVATEVAIFTRHGVERLMRFAFDTARNREKSQITIVTKSSAQRKGLMLWDDVAAEVAKEYPDVECDSTSVDKMTTRMVLHPDSLDTIVATNLHADILSDLAASLTGSIGLTPTSNLDPTRQNPSMFGPVHGSNSDIAGKGVANPVAAIWAAAEMVRWLGHDEAAESLLDCVEKVCEAGVKTPDLGGNATTNEVTNAVCRELERELGFSLVPSPSLRRRIAVEKYKRKLGFDVVTTSRL
ncbi:hypothetical protein MMC07_001721 [Pseudocyphellaria aurata]|nr:hypothetical protein [Pseudocyphellaria aurata]